MKAVFFHGVPGGGALGVLLRSTACCSSPGWRLGGGRGGGGRLSGGPPQHCCLPSEDSIPMQAAAKFLNRIGGCQPLSLGCSDLKGSSTLGAAQ